MRNKARYVDKEYLAKELYDFDNVTNSSESLYGAEINLVHKYKSDFILSINQKKPAQFISTLNSTLVEHPDENSKFVPIDTKNTLINAVAFDFNKLVCISDVDYDFKLLKISTNNDLLNLISKSYKN
jgi:hypothetical protein